MNKLFTYGTLRQGTAATHYLSGYKLFNYYDKFPYIQRTGDSHDFVKGNVVELTDKELAECDRYENIAKGLYTREQVEVYALGERNGDVAAESTQVYVALDIAPQPIASGDWYAR